MTSFVCPPCRHEETQPSFAEFVAHWCRKARRWVDLERREDG